jgi:hypothetical protein
MAKIGPIKLKVDVNGTTADVDVQYDIVFSATDQRTKQVYEEECRLMGDDTNPNDPPAAGGDDTLGFVSPLFDKVTAGTTATLARHLTKSFRTRDLDEDKGQIPNPDEIRAQVTLRPTAPAAGRSVHRRSPMVKLNLG